MSDVREEYAFGHPVVKKIEKDYHMGTVSLDALKGLWYMFIPTLVKY